MALPAKPLAKDLVERRLCMLQNVALRRCAVKIGARRASITDSDIVIRTVIGRNSFRRTLVHEETEPWD
jgi:hypothetical protein